MKKILSFIRQSPYKTQVQRLFLWLADSPLVLYFGQQCQEQLDLLGKGENEGQKMIHLTFPPCISWYFSYSIERLECCISVVVVDKGIFLGKHLAHGHLQVKSVHLFFSFLFFFCLFAVLPSRGVEVCVVYACVEQFMEKE